jgi:hypothetical protein
MRFPKGHAARGLLQEKLEDELDESDVAVDFDEENRERRVEQRIQEIAEADWDEASGLSREQHGGLRDALRGEREAAQMPLAKLQAEYEEEMEKAAAREHPEEPFARFHREAAIADVPWWAKADAWTLEEGVMLLLGRDPRKVTADVLEQWRGKSPFVKRYDELLELARRAKLRSLLDDHVKPTDFLDWAGAKITEAEAERIAPLHRAVHSRPTARPAEELETEVETLRRQNEQLTAELKSLEGRAKPTFYKLVYLLAAGNKETFTTADLPKKVQWIVGKAPEAGLSADDEPIRECLKEAIDYVARKSATKKHRKT